MRMAKVNSGLDRMMASPRGCVAYSALDAVRNAVSFVSRLLGIKQTSPANLFFVADDQSCEAFALNRDMGEQPPRLARRRLRIP
jgi:hypothetical protein